MTCENCDRKSTFLKQQIFSVLKERGLEPNIFIKADPDTRLGLILKHYQLEKMSNEIKPNIEPQKIPTNLGLITIKPEMVHAQKKVESFLSDYLGIKILYAKEFTYLPEEYWKIYGQDYINQQKIFPHGPLLFLLSITSPSKLILFKHPNPSKYEKLIKHNYNLDNLDKKMGDLQAIFTAYFVRGKNFSLRENVCKPEISNSGLSSMKPDLCPTICWDFTNSFSQRTVDQNERTFNGVHSPENRDELLSNLMVLKRIL